MKKIIKHYPMTGRLIVTRGYMFPQMTAFWLLLDASESSNTHLTLIRLQKGTI